MGEPALSRALEATRQIRDIGALRKGVAHGNPSVAPEVIDAHKRLGLPAYLSDYAGAWAIVQGRLAAALDAIRESVQYGSSAED